MFLISIIAALPIVRIAGYSFAWEPKTAVWLLLLALLGIVVIFPVLFLWKLLAAPAQIYYEQLDKIERLEEELRGTEGVSLDIVFDENRHVDVASTFSDRWYVVFVGVTVKGPVGVERAGLRIQDIVPPKGRKKTLQAVVSRIKGRPIIGYFKKEEREESFPVDVGVETRVAIFESKDGSVCFFSPRDYNSYPCLPNGAYEIELLAHGSGAMPCRKRFRITNTPKKFSMKSVEGGVP